MQSARQIIYAAFYVLFLPTFMSCKGKNNNSPTDVNSNASAPDINYSILALHPHDTTLFTEGFVFYKGNLYESSGAPPELPFTESVIGTTNLSTGIYTPKIKIDKKIFFGEGIVFLNDKLYQLTYKNKIGFIYDARTFKKLGAFTYTNAEGWALTTDGNNIIMSDGTDALTYINPQTMQPVKVLKVTEAGAPRDSLNELEYINGFIYANIWMEPYIVKIDTATGKVVGKINLQPIVNDAKARKLNVDVLNGIAYDSVNNKMFITGKLWPTVYEIDFVK